MDDRSQELGDAARRALQRAGVHFLRAAIEVVQGLGAVIEEVRAAGSAEDRDDGERERIELD